MRSPKFFSQMIASGITLSIAASFGVTPSPSTVPPVRAHISFSNYQVSGDNDQEIRASLRQNGPADSHATPRDAFTRWKIRWDWRLVKRGFIDPRSVTVSVEAQVSAPVLSAQNPVSPRWADFRIKLIRHELRHLRNALDGARELASQFQEGETQHLMPVAVAHRLADLVIEKTRAADREYDELTDHGRTEGVRW